MTAPRRLLPPLLLIAMIMPLTATQALADDRSFSSVVKYIQKNYNGKRQGTFGAISFARFLVKVIKPAGVKNFKVVMFKSVDFSHIKESEDIEFNHFLQTTVSPEWMPLVQYASRRAKQWTYVYSTEDGSDMKFLVVTMHQKQAFVVQVKFSPEKLIAFIDDDAIARVDEEAHADVDRLLRAAGHQEVLRRTHDAAGAAQPQRELTPQDLVARHVRVLEGALPQDALHHGADRLHYSLVRFAQAVHEVHGERPRPPRDGADGRTRHLDDAPPVTGEPDRYCALKRGGDVR